MSNRLKNETSPYLLSHAENPVDWYPWGEEAFEKARREDKPIFLSIGYSTCHWCHVMARESFQNASVAELLNRYFVSIKVDREERPDIDSIYMSACTAMTGSGGWPLTIIMTPEAKPFFAGTYLPRMNTNGRMGFVSLLNVVAAKWQCDRAELIKAADEITSFIAKPRETESVSADRAFLDSAAKQLEDSFDKEYGGFGSSPKFPSAHTLIFLMRYAQLTGDKNARAEVDTTLQWMYRGGIHDHIGGGFSRYSTDREWLAPHFEKTLYDNALLALAYTEAWQNGRFALYKTAALTTIDYCIRELSAIDGGYFAGQDADSCGSEGAYYLFTTDELKKVLGEDAGRHFAECYDITDEGNFKGKSIPNIILNQRWNLIPEGYRELREKLLQYRMSRMPLPTDDKVLTGWNGLMLAALSRAGKAFGEAYYLDRAEELFGFIREKLYVGGRLMAGMCKSKIRAGATLSDYAFAALGALEYYDATYDVSALRFAKSLADFAIGRFASADGTFFTTPDDGEKLIIRPTEYYDGAMPSANSAMAVVLDKLFIMTGESEYSERLTALLKRLCGVSGAYPAGCAFGLTALMSGLSQTREIVCVTDEGTAPAALDRITERFDPFVSVILKTPENAAELAETAPFTADMKTAPGKTTLYVCSGGTCAQPIEI